VPQHSHVRVSQAKQSPAQRRGHSHGGQALLDVAAVPVEVFLHQGVQHVALVGIEDLMGDENFSQLAILV
jgi:hypothetical protein